MLQCRLVGLLGDGLGIFRLAVRLSDENVQQGVRHARYEPPEFYPRFRPDPKQPADICGGMGAATQEARVRLWLAETLVEQNRRGEADVELQRALAFYRSVGATRYIRQAEGLLAASA